MSLAASEATEEVLVGRTLSHFEVESALGEGGKGRVFLARDIHLDRRVAARQTSDSLPR